MKYKIHSDLKSYSKAISKLAKGGEAYFEEALAVIKK